MIGRGKEDRCQPDPFNSQAFSGHRIPIVEIIHPVDDSPQIADAVPIRIGEGADEDLIEHPMIVFHLQAISFRNGKAAQKRERQNQNDKAFHGYSLLSATFTCIMQHLVFLVK